MLYALRRVLLFSGLCTVDIILAMVTLTLAGADELDDTTIDALYLVKLTCWLYLFDTFTIMFDELVIFGVLVITTGIVVGIVVVTGIVVLTIPVPPPPPPVLVMPVLLAPGFTVIRTTELVTNGVDVPVSVALNLKLY